MTRPSDDAAPEAIEAETTDPNNAEQLKVAAERVGWMQVLVLAALGTFIAGGTAYGVMGRLATKTDLAEALRAHAAAPSDPALVRRLDEMERWRSAHEAEHRADLQWLKESMSRIESAVREREERKRVR
jgi:hypothetical protein